MNNWILQDQKWLCFDMEHNLIATHTVTKHDGGIGRVIWEAPMSFQACPKSFKLTGATPKMKHSREDYADTAREMYKDDPTVEIGSTIFSRADGMAVTASILISDVEVERRKGPFFAGEHNGDECVLQRVNANSDSPYFVYATVVLGTGVIFTHRAHKIADAVNAQWRVEKEQSS